MYNNQMKLSRVVEYVFFFGLLILTGYLVWLILAPFLTALALSLIIVTICHPLYLKIKDAVPRKNKSLAAFLSTLLVLTVIILPLVLMSSLVVKEVVTFFQQVSTEDVSLISRLADFETQVSAYIPGFEINLSQQVYSIAPWVTGNLGAIFAGTISTLFIFFISLIGSFYFFRDGKELLQIVIKASPLPDHEDRIILNRLGKAVRAVATGTVLVALIQGSLVAVGFTIFGIERAIIWGSFASLGALIPGIGTTIVTVPAIVFLFFTGEMGSGLGLLVWSIFIVGLVDNFIGPYLMSRGNNLHPFIILISVLGGIILLGPIGFIIGPVVVTLFVVLLEIYDQYIIREKPVTPD